jgi:hypothetical protein
MAVVQFTAEAGIFLFTTPLSSIWIPPSLLPNAYQELFPWCKVTLA